MSERVSDEHLKDLWWFLDTLAKQDLSRGSTFGECREALQELIEASATIATLQTELDLQKGANRAQDERERVAAEALGMAHSCDWPDDVRERVMTLEKALADASEGAHLALASHLRDQARIQELEQALLDPTLGEIEDIYGPAENDAGLEWRCGILGCAVVVISERRAALSKSKEAQNG